MWMHPGLSGGLLLLVLDRGGALALAQSSTVADVADTGVILRPVTLGARRVVAEAGTWVYIPAATWIGVENTGRESASGMGHFRRGAVEPCFRRLVERPTPADSARLERHCAMTFKGSAR